MPKTEDRDYIVKVPKRNFLVKNPKRVFQTISDSSFRVVGGVEFTQWGQTDITLDSVLETFGALP